MSARVRLEQLEVSFPPLYKKQFTVDTCEFVSNLRGLVIGLVGPTGCGKSSLLAGVCGKLPKSFLRGSIVTEATVISFLPQGSFIFPHLTATENVSYYSSLQRFSSESNRIPESARDVAKELGLNLNRLDSQPHETWSGGQVQKIGICRALSVRADLLCLDEPCSGLSPTIRRRLLRLLRARARQTQALILLATHIGEDLLWCCDHILVWDGDADEVGYQVRSLDMQSAIANPPSEDCRLHFNPFANLDLEDEHKTEPGTQVYRNIVTSIPLWGKYELCENVDGYRWIQASKTQASSV